MMRTVRRAALLWMIFVLALMPLAVAAQDSTPAATEEAPTEEVEIEATAVSTEESAEVEEEPAATVEGEEAAESPEAAEGEESAEEEAHGEEANSIPQGISLLMFLLGILAVGIVGLVSIRARALEAEDETPPAE